VVQGAPQKWRTAHLALDVFYLTGGDPLELVAALDFSLIVNHFWS
jgi:hypothetical protein